MSQNVMANLYDITKNNIPMYLKNIFYEGEIQKDSVVNNFLITVDYDPKNKLSIDFFFSKI